MEGSATFTIDASITITNWVIARSRSAKFLARGEYCWDTWATLGDVIWKLTSGSVCIPHYMELRFRLSRPPGENSVTTETPSPTGTNRCLRADARRHRERILESARAVCAE